MWQRDEARHGTPGLLARTFKLFEEFHLGFAKRCGSLYNVRAGERQTITCRTDDPCRRYVCMDGGLARTRSVDASLGGGGPTSEPQTLSERGKTAEGESSCVNPQDPHPQRQICVKWVSN